LLPSLTSVSMSASYKFLLKIKYLLTKIGKKLWAFKGGGQFHANAVTI